MYLLIFEDMGVQQVEAIGPIEDVHIGEGYLTAYRVNDNGFFEERHNGKWTLIEIYKEPEDA